VHPHEIGSEDPSEDKHIDCAEDKAAQTNPCEAGKSFKEPVVKLDTLCATKREKPAQDTENVGHLRPKDTFPAV